MEFAKFVVTSTRVCEYFNTIQTHENMWARGGGQKIILKDKYTIYLAGVNNSSHNSTPMQVSIVLTTASPNGTFTWSDVVKGRGGEEIKRH